MKCTSIATGDLSLHASAATSTPEELRTHRAQQAFRRDQSWIPGMSFSGHLVVKWLASLLTDPWQFNIIGT